MIDSQEIHSTPRPPVFAVLFTLAGCGLVSAGLVTHHPAFYLLAIPAAAAAIGLWCSRPRPFAAELTGTGLRVSSGEEIPFSAIESVTLNGRPQDPQGKLKPGPVGVIHKQGVVEIPVSANVPVVDLYHTLLARSAASSSCSIHPDLRSFHDNEVQTFGVERVWCYGARSRLGRRASIARSRLICILAGVTGIAWLVLPPWILRWNTEDAAPWMGIGAMALVLSFLIFLLLLIGQRSREGLFKNWQSSNVVVGPSGIAVVQGDLKGTLRWDELLDVKVGVKGPLFSFAGSQDAHGGLHLTVAGAVIRIADVYDRPLPCMAAVIRQYWKRPTKAG
jgi:hypothetical protein